MPNTPGGFICDDQIPSRSQAPLPNIASKTLPSYRELRIRTTVALFPTVMSEITPSRLSARLDAQDDDPFVLDVQPTEDYDDWHVPGSTNIDIAEELRSDPEAAREALRAIPSDEVILTCAAGDASEQAADQLQDLGYEVRLLSCLRP